MNTRITDLEKYYKDPTKPLLETHAVTTGEGKDVALTNEEIKELKGSMIVTGFKKDAVLGLITLELQVARLFNESRIHPETLKLMEQVSFAVEYGHPVEKELLFKVVPEAFPSEIRHMKFEDQRKYLKPRVRLGYINKPELADVRSHLEDRPKTNEKLMEEKIMSMLLYHWDQTNDFAKYYMPYMKERVQQFKYKNELEYLKDLLVMDEDKLTEVEKRMVKEIKALQNIHEDIVSLHLRREDVVLDDLNELPFPILDTKYKEKLIKAIKYQYKYETIDFKDVS